MTEITSVLYMNRRLAFILSAFINTEDGSDYYLHVCLSAHPLVRGAECRISDKSVLHTALPDRNCFASSMALAPVQHYL